MVQAYFSRGYIFFVFFWIATATVAQPLSPQAVPDVTMVKNCAARGSPDQEAIRRCTGGLLVTAGTILTCLQGGSCEPIGFADLNTDFDHRAVFAGGGVNLSALPPPRSDAHGCPGVNCQRGPNPPVIALPAAIGHSVDPLPGQVDGRYLVKQFDGTFIDVRLFAENGLFLPPVIPSSDQVAQCRLKFVSDDAFRMCVVESTMSSDQKRVFDCFKNGQSGGGIAACALSGSLSYQDRMLMGCLTGNSAKSSRDLVACAGSGFLGRYQPAYDCLSKNSDNPAMCVAANYLTPDQRQWISCYQDHQDDEGVSGLVACGTAQYLNDDEARALKCVTSAQDTMGMATCMVAGGLTPEQQIIVSCVGSAASGPQSYAICVAGRLAARELTKCFDKGIGGEGCFGPNNDIVKVLGNIGNDLQHGLGSSNSIRIAISIAANDVQHGLGKNNDIVQTLANMQSDLEHGPGENNDIRKGLHQLGIL